MVCWFTACRVFVVPVCMSHVAHPRLSHIMLISKTQENSYFRQSGSEQSFSACAFGAKQKFYFFFFSAAPYLKTSDIWFSLSYRSFLPLKRSAGAEALEAAIYPSVAVKCTTHISPGYLERDWPPPQSPEPQRAVTQPSHTHTHTHTHTPQETLSLKTHRRKLFVEKKKKKNDKHTLSWFLFCSLHPLRFLLIRGTYRHD